MNCIFCPDIILQRHFHGLRCYQCGTYYTFFEDNLISYYFRYKDFLCVFIIRNDHEKIFYITKFGEHIMDLNYHPNITPQNIETVLIFL